MKNINHIPEGHWPDKPLLTEEDLMQIFGVSKSSIRRWRLNNVIPFFKLGGTYFTSLEYLRELLMEKIDESFKKFHDQNKREQSKQNANDTK